MPSLAGNDDRPGCFPATARDHRLPNITSIVSLRSVSKHADDSPRFPSYTDNRLIKGNTNDNADNNNNDTEHDSDAFIRRDTRTRRLHETTGSSVHFKLPVIGLSKSYKVQDGITYQPDHQQNLNTVRGRSLARPLACLTNVEERASHQNAHETAIFDPDNVSPEARSTTRSADTHSVFREDSHVSKLPNIFQKGILPNSSLVHSSINSRNTAFSNRDVIRRLSFKRESSIASISGQDLSLVGRRSTLCHRTEANALPKPRTQVSPLLLPMSVHTDPSVFARKTSKGKHNIGK